MPCCSLALGARRLAAAAVLCGALPLMVGCESAAISQSPPEQASDGSQPKKPASNQQRAEDEPGPAAQEPGEQGDSKQPAPKQPVIDPTKPPFAHRFDIPEFPKDMEWLNSAPLRKADLKGKFVLLDFWTYCCINCMHILPELKKLEQAYPDQLVVIGVHSAKFDTEKETENIRQAIRRYEIEHPVVNDHKMEIWDSYGVSSWPTVLMVDPEGFAVWGSRGEIEFAEVDAVLKRALPYYRHNKLLDETPLHFDLEIHRLPETPLRYPGKVLADEAGGRLFISDSNHNRLVITTLAGELLEVIGAGPIGQADGDYETATFNKPQGVALVKSTLYVADTENHLLRKIDLDSKRVSTIAGVGAQGRVAWPGLEALERGGKLPERWVGPPLKTPINSPWALWAHGGDLFIAMAGPHQIWKMPLDESEIGPYSGNGREDIVDGPLLPKQPYEMGYASFAQPSGLTSDGEWLYVADSEGSSIRAVPLKPGKEVRTVVGTDDLPHSRLFTFGLVDGPREKALLQHVLCVTYVDGVIYFADTYNHAIRAVDAKTGFVSSIAGAREPHPTTGAPRGKKGASDAEGSFSEPAGIAHAAGKLYVADTNNHLLRVVDLKTKKVSTLQIQGLAPPRKPAAASKPDFSKATQVKVEPLKLKPVDGKTRLRVEIALPVGWKINGLAPMKHYLEATGDTGPLARDKLGVSTKVSPPAASFVVEAPVNGAGRDELKLHVNYYYCQEGDNGLCKTGAALFVVPLEVADDGAAEGILKHVVKE